MPSTLEERVAYLEGKVEEHTSGLKDVKGMFVHLDGRFLILEQRIAETNTRIDNIVDTLSKRIDSIKDELSAQISKTNERIDSTNEKIDSLSNSINQRIDSINDSINKRIDAANGRIDKLFYFIIATLASSIGSLIAIIVSMFLR